MMENYITSNVLGTCYPLLHWLEDFMKTFNITDETEALDLMEKAAIEAEVSMCDQCGWWVESYELDEHNFCEDCQDDN